MDMVTVFCVWFVVGVIAFSLVALFATEVVSRWVSGVFGAPKPTYGWPHYEDCD